MLLTPSLIIPPSLPSLRFGTATSDRIDCGNPTILTDIATGTICAWVYNTVTATNQRLWVKGTLANIHHFRLTTSRLAIVITRATTPLNVEATVTNWSAYATNKWVFIAGQFDTTGAAGAQRIYMGDTILPSAEPSSYNIAQTAGSGAMATDAGANFCIGNATASTTVSWVGNYGFFGMWNRLLTYAEIEQQRLQFVSLTRNWDTQGALIYGFPGANGQAYFQDMSGYGNHGIVTGAVPVVSSPFNFAGAA